MPHHLKSKTRKQQIRSSKNNWSVLTENEQVQQCPVRDRENKQLGTFQPLNPDLLPTTGYSFLPHTPDSLVISRFWIWGTFFMGCCFPRENKTNKQTKKPAGVVSPTCAIQTLTQVGGKCANQSHLGE
ncbi:hypothetical protein AVEN_12294-1 [Araneus ventricosus]|uniref:Uncharacterized protein n=1 Tax=Araneus ventricosus TaxID=182803 RepID=A0A4Y2E8A6_ARAVE|nr:hypothetical protein AVEN_12294-1 [Araneus ventricosus]